MTRYIRCTTLLLCAALAVGACKKTKAEADPSYEPRITMEDVDDTLAQHVPADRVRVPYDDGAAIKGAAEPLVTIVEFSDFQCPFCGAFAQTLDELVTAYPDDVRIVFMQYPMPMHPNAEIAAKATIAAQAQGKFWAMHDLAFANRTKLGRDDLIEHAQELGLDPEKFAADLDAEATQKRLDQEVALGRRLGVRGTPSFFVNGQRHVGAKPAEELQKIVEEERELAKALMDAGAKRKAVYAHITRAARPTGTNPGPKRLADPPAQPADAP